MLVQVLGLISSLKPPNAHPSMCGGPNSKVKSATQALIFNQFSPMLDYPKVMDASFRISPLLSHFAPGLAP